MAITRIKNNQITDASAGNIYLGVNAAVKLQDYSITSGKIANDLTYNSSLTITGNLTVQGNTTTIDTTNLTVEDPIIILASEQTGSPSLDIGFIGERGDSENITLVWKEDADTFVMAFTNDLVTNTTVSISSYADFKANNIVANGTFTANGTSTLVGNASTGNLDIGTNKVFTVGAGSTTDFNLINLSNVADPVSAQDVATKNYVDTSLSSIFTLEDDATNTTTVADGDTVQMLGTANEVDVVVGNLSVTFGLPDDVTIGNTLTVTANVDAGNVNAVSAITAGTTIDAVGNITGGNLVTAGDVTTATVTASSTIDATGNITGGNLITVGITDTGSLTASTTIDATGNITGGNLLTAGLIDATGNITGGNIDTAGQVVATGNITGGNLITAGVTDTGSLTASTTIDATGNITGGNLITAGLASIGTTLDVTGNANVGNLGTAGLIVATGNIDGGNINTAGDVIAAGNVNGANVNTDSIVGTNIVITATSVDMELTGNLSMSGRFINDLGTPAAATDAATKQYVDDAVSSGIHIHTPVDVETPTALPAATYAQGGTTATVTDTVAGNTVVFSSAVNPQVNDQLWFTNSFQGIVANTSYFVVSAPNTSAAVLSTTYNGVPVTNITSASGLTEAVRINSGVGATLTANTNGALTVDGFSVSAGNRVLVYNQGSQLENGVYSVTDAGNVSAPWILTRATDSDQYIPDSNDGLDQGSYFYVKFGDTGAGESYVLTAPVGPFVIGYDNIEFTQFSASQVYSANTSAGLVLNGTVFSAKVDNDTTAFDGGGNIIVKAGANLVTPNIGNAVGNSLTVTGNIEAGNLISSGAVIGNVEISGNLEVANLTVTDLFTGNNVSISNTISATGNITGGNLISNALVSGTDVQATSLTQNRVVYVGANDYLADSANFTFDGTNANLQGQMIIDNFTIDGTGITSNANISVASSSDGNIDITPNGTGVVNINNIAIADNTISSTTGNIVLDPAANIVLPDETASAVLYTTANNELETSSNFTYNGTQANITGNLNVQGVTVLDNFTVDGTSITSNANLTITSSADGNVDVTPNGTGVVNIDNITIADNTIGSSSGNIVIDPAGTINLPDELANAILYTGSANQVSTDANLTYDGTNVQLLNGNIAVGDAVANTFVTNEGIQGTGRLVINQDSSDVDFAVNGDTNANIFYIDAGTETASFGNSTQTTNAIVSFNATNSILIPIGNSAQRPDVPVTGMVRFNTTLDNLEFYDSDSWVSAGSVFTLIDSEVFNGDGSTVAYTLNSEQTTDSCIVSINGIVQIPVVAYAVSGNVLTFTEAPLSQDVIEVRQLTTTVTVRAISNSSGNALIEVEDTSSNVYITGNVTPTANVAFNLGSPTNRFNEIYLAGSSIYLGNLILKNTTGNTFAFFGPDGTTPGTLDSNNVDTTSIANGTANVRTFSADNSATISAGGQANVAVITSSGVQITGDLSVTGNATLSGNILGDRIQNGTTTIDIQTINGNANISVAGVSNVAVFTSTGVAITGTLSSSGNANVGNLGTAGLITATGNITGGNLITAGLVSLSSITKTGSNGVGNIGSSTSTFNTIFAKATSAQYADLAEMYEADAEYAPGTVVHFGGAKEVTLCDTANCRRVAGVVSTNPSYLMNSAQTGEHVVAVALTGRVPCRVKGPVAKGDLMVSAGDGSAMANNDAGVGTVIGKALQDFAGTEGVIEVVVGRV